jgi:hypothetical protein
MTETPRDVRAENMAAENMQRERDHHARRAAVANAEERDRLTRDRAETAAAACRERNAPRIAEIRAQLEAAPALQRELTALVAEGYARHHHSADLRAQLADLEAQRVAAPQTQVAVVDTTGLAPHPLDEQIQELRSKIEGLRS